MKKYCFTDCFKQKVSRGKRIVITIIAMLSTVIAILTGLVVAVTLIGVATQFISVGLDSTSGIFAYNPFMVGLITTFLLLVATVAIGGIWLILDTTYNFFKKLIEGRISPPKFECKIFEECKEE